MKTVFVTWDRNSKDLAMVAVNNQFLPLPVELRNTCGKKRSDLPLTLFTHSWRQFSHYSSPPRLYIHQSQVVDMYILVYACPLRDPDYTRYWYPILVLLKGLPWKHTKQNRAYVNCSELLPWTRSTNFVLFLCVTALAVLEFYRTGWPQMQDINPPAFAWVLKLTKCSFSIWEKKNQRTYKLFAPNYMTEEPLIQTQI